MALSSYTHVSERACQEALRDHQPEPSQGPHRPDVHRREVHRQEGSVQGHDGTRPRDVPRRAGQPQAEGSHARRPWLLRHIRGLGVQAPHFRVEWGVSGVREKFEMQLKRVRRGETSCSLIRTALALLPAKPDEAEPEKAEKRTHAHGRRVDRAGGPDLPIARPSLPPALRGPRDTETSRDRATTGKGSQPVSSRMANDGRFKRLKTSKDGGTNADLWERRIAELESENEKLRLENALFRARLSEGVNAAVLPVVVTTTVDLSRFDTSLVAQISSFLGTACELFNMALTCKSFGWRQPASTEDWSLVEEVARQAVRSRATNDEMSGSPQYSSGTTTWLSILHRFENLLNFFLLGYYIKHRHGDKNTACGTNKQDCCTAVSRGYVMRSGAHYAEFNIFSGGPYIGIVRPMPSLDAPYDYQFYFIGSSFYSRFLAQRSDNWGNGNVHACEYWSYDGTLNWTDWGEEDQRFANWEGMESCSTGDTIGMLLNLDNGTLTVYKNNRRLGVMKDGLSGSYCWYATVDGNDLVAIRKGLPPVLNDNKVSGSR
ncbi:hypothetical protein THAOC_27977 [Thalassiosira oceanica]|uniref:B30.2/SPRY domain-containing protein n=1 Tax=Thalassiosira oceanica TaxID=159749 RepID=K0RGA7_THAOC|nr:hypothetical protein THAOC_27977 [Thalassiosira oceanica]|eukprot:EJK52723.1 hypothetical protein THAOC_27977 [Thalassiosira oceanica]